MLLRGVVLKKEVSDPSIKSCLGIHLKCVSKTSLLCSTWTEKRVKVGVKVT